MGKKLDQIIIIVYSIYKFYCRDNKLFYLVYYEIDK